MKTFSFFALILTTLIVLPQPAAAKVVISIDGFSNGTQLSGYKGPAGINQRISLSKSGGSVREAAARAVYEKYRIFLGNKEVSKGTKGDPQFTHVRGGSVFYGKATFHAAKKGASVKNFKLNYTMHGDLRCATTDKTVPENYSKASVEAQIRFNHKDVFAGSATVDGATGFDGGKLKLAGKFKAKSTKDVSINRVFPLNLGTLKDGQKYPTLFFGATLISYAADVPIKNCEANFQRTAEFSVPDDVAKKQGKFEYQPATAVSLVLKPQPWPLTQTQDLRVYVESANSSLLNTIDINTVQLFTRLGDSGSLQPTAIEDTGDVDTDGVPDRALVFSQTSLIQLLDFQLLNLTQSGKLTLIGDTTAGEPFLGAAGLTVTPSAIVNVP